MQIDSQGRVFTEVHKEFFHSVHENKDNGHIYVVSPNNKIYLGICKKYVFNHSSFLSGGPVKSAGVFIFDQGKIKAVWDNSGHYNSSLDRGYREPITPILKLLITRGIDIKNIKVMITKRDGANRSIATQPAEEFLNNK